jgi:hypothetical protein
VLERTTGEHVGLRVVAIALLGPAEVLHRDVAGQHGDDLAFEIGAESRRPG